MSENFDNEDFEEVESKLIEDNPLQEGEPQVGVVLASERINVRYYENMTVQDALNQVRGKPEDEKFRLLLDGKVSSLDSIVPTANTEIIFVGNWTLGKKKVTTTTQN